MPEGSIAFPNEPLLRVTAPFREALLLESGLLQAINLATLIATKASRVVWAAGAARSPSSRCGARRSRSWRRARRTSAAASAPRSSARRSASACPPPAPSRTRWSSCSTPSARPSRPSPTPTTATRCCSTRTIRARRSTPPSRWRSRARDRLGHILAAVRLDSGDLAGDARYVRGVLDAAGLHEVRIAASGDLDEFSIADLLDAGRADRLVRRRHQPGRRRGLGRARHRGRRARRRLQGGLLRRTSADGHAKVKIAGDKSTWPGVKEVYRVGRFDDGHRSSWPTSRSRAGSERLLKPVVLDGDVVAGSLPPLSEIWELAQANLRRLPDEYRQLVSPRPYPVRISDAIRAMRERPSPNSAASGPSRGERRA